MTLPDTAAHLPGSQQAAAVVLAVDEPAILSALARLLHPDGVRVLTASGGEEALRLLEQYASSIDVLISDYAMPGMNGAELLRSARFRWPDITRVLLTGNADLPAAGRAVNDGQLSRLYTKPWQPDEFRRAVTEAVRLRATIRENGRLRALAEEQAARLAQWNQRLEELVAERTTCKEIARLAARLAERAGLAAEEVCRVQVAALIHDIGLIGVPEAVLRCSWSELTLAGRTRYEGHSAIGHSILSPVEQLTELATWIRHHHERWDGRGYPDRLAGAAIPPVSRIIALADGYVEAVAREGGTAANWRHSQVNAGAYDPALLPLLDDEVRGRPASLPGHDQLATQVREGMVLDAPIRAASGAVLLPAGQRLTRDHIERLRQFSRQGALAVDSVACRRDPHGHAPR
jgi:response regulator RpfG family c-di-GMP phosphodiesterase